MKLKVIKGFHTRLFGKRAADAVFEVDPTEANKAHADGLIAQGYVSGSRLDANDAPVTESVAVAAPVAAPVAAKAKGKKA